MKPLSDAILNSKKSKIRVLFDMLLNSGPEAISFGIGQTDFRAPEFVNAAIAQALAENKTQYAPALGLPKLLQLAAKKFREENGIPRLTDKNIIITNGGSQALMLAYAVLTNPGDEVVFDGPNFLSYYYLCDYFGLRLREIPRNADYSPNIDLIEKSITPKTKFILINSPNNPTGYLMTKEEMDRIVKIVLEHDLYLISDEVYEVFIYNGTKHISPASYPGMVERTITINAMSKTFGATGLRLGYIAAPENIIMNMEKYIQYTTAGVNHPTQYGAIAAFENQDKIDFDKIRQEYDIKRKICVDRLASMGFIVNEPQGAFYIMPKLNPKWGVDADKFSEMLVKEKKVACVPGSGFGEYAYDSLRISYATSVDLLNRGFDRMADFLNEHGFSA